jgi:hypothetical protein
MLQRPTCVARKSKVLQYGGSVSQLKHNLLHYAIATLTSATTFNQKVMVEKVLLLPFLGLLQHFLGVALDRNPCSEVWGRYVSILSKVPLMPNLSLGWR